MLAFRLADAARGRVTDPRARKLTVTDLLTLVEDDYQVNGRRSARRLRAFGTHLGGHFQRQPAIGLTAADIKRHIAVRQKAGAANATINRELAALRRGFRLALDAGFLPSIPPIRALRERNVRTGFLEPAQVAAIRRHLRPDRRPDLQVAVSIAYTFGWRMQSEVLTLELRQLDLAAGTLRLDPGTTKNDEGRLRLPHPGAPGPPGRPGGPREGPGAADRAHHPGPVPAPDRAAPRPAHPGFSPRVADRLSQGRPARNAPP